MKKFQKQKSRKNLRNRKRQKSRKNLERRKNLKSKLEYIDNEEEDKNDLNDDSISVNDNIDPNVLKKKKKYIVLIIDCVVKEAKEEPLETELIREIKKNKH